MEISVIIPTLNRESDLLNTIADLEKQADINYEVIIIDQSDKSIDHRFNERKYVKYLHRPDFKSASRARNLGLLCAKYEIILFLDDDVIIKNESYLSSLVNNFNEGYNGATGPILDYPKALSQSFRSRYSYNSSWGWLFFPRNYDKETEIFDAGAGNLCVRRNMAIDVGGMDEQFEKGAFREESDFNYRYTKIAGPYKYDPKCEIIHIGAKNGGIRSWNQNEVKIKAQHHFTGFWYFLFKNVSWYHVFPHFVVAYIYFFRKKHFLLKPILLIKSMFRFVNGAFLAIKKIVQGPRYITE